MAFLDSKNLAPGRCTANDPHATANAKGRRPARARHIAALTLLLMAHAPAFGADYAREQRWEEEIAPAIVVGDPQYLSASGHRFLSIFAPARSAKAAVILAHGLGVHPDWGLIHGLRTGLTDSGYSTLSVQMPVLGKEAGPDDYEIVLPEAAARLAAAMAFLADKGYDKIAIVSHSMGARMSNAFLARTPSPSIAAWVAIAIPGAFRNPTALKLPILDIYGEDDFQIVLDGVSKRGIVVEALAGAKQVRLPGANHFFDGREDELLKHVQSYLDATLRE